MALLAAFLAFGMAPRAASSRGSPQVGETYEITRTEESSQKSGEGSSGSSSDKDTIIERVVGVRPDGLELEYDLPKESTAEERSRDWQLPVRVFKPQHGPAQLLDRAELEARIDKWLKAANWTRAACGHWIFTWNAFLVDCDPESAIKTVEAFDLRSADVRDGASYADPMARGTGLLTRKSTGLDGDKFVAELPIDADAVRREGAKSDVVVAEITGKPVTLEAAFRKRTKDVISGRMSVEFETDPSGNVRRRTKVTTVQTQSADGKSETNTITQTLERHLISAPR